jgi:tyrosyl-tRNA synthetase
MKDIINKMISKTANVVSAEALEEKLKKNKSLRIKFGADPSAPDLHLGHFVVMKKLRQLQDMGHTVVLIIGDFTAMIGDPSGRSKTRKMLSREKIEKNVKTYEEQCFMVLRKDRTEIRYNSEWLGKMNFSDVIKLSSYYTVARMLERDDFEKRYKTGVPISVSEFMYPLAQAYVSVAVKADIEVGGTDQTFNLLVGRDIMREYGLEPQVIMTFPILEGTDGVNKMSKSLGNYIAFMDSPNEMFG